MMFGGTEEPTAFCTLSSIGAIGGAKNKTISKAVCEVLQARVSSIYFYIFLSEEMQGEATEKWTCSCLSYSIDIFSVDIETELIYLIVHS